MAVKTKAKVKQKHRPIPSISRDPLAQGVAAGSAVRRPPATRSNPGTSLLSGSGMRSGPGLRY